MKLADKSLYGPERQSYVNTCTYTVLSLFCALLITTSASPSIAATYYLDAVNGDDSSAGTSSSPWKTMAKAETSVTNGSTVFLRSGNYGVVYISKTGLNRSSWVDGVTYAAQEGHTPIFDQLRITASEDRYLRFENIDIVALQTGTAIRGVVDIVDSSFIQIVNCNIRGWFDRDGSGMSSYGVFLQGQLAGPGVSNILIDDCDIQGAAEGIKLYHHILDNIVIRNNEIHLIAASIIALDSTPDDTVSILIENNHLYDRRQRPSDHGSGISVRDNNVIIRGNIIRDFGGSGSICFYAGSASPGGDGSFENILIENNLIYDGQGTTGLRFWNLMSNVTIRNNTIIGWYDSELIAKRRYTAAMSLRATGDLTDISIYNNIFVGPVDVDGSLYTGPGGTGSLKFSENNNIYWSFHNDAANTYESTLDVSSSIIITHDGGYNPGYNENYFEASGNFFIGGALFDQYSYTRVWNYDPAYNQFSSHKQNLNDAYKLAAGSDAIGFADPVNSTATDLLGNVRDANPDAGCYEFTGSITTYTITASGGQGGSISPSGEVAIAEGSDRTFTITADTGYHIDDLLVDGVSQGAISSYTFANVTAAHTISVSFAVSPTYTITASSGTGGSISPSGDVTVTEGNNRTFTITADTGYQIADVLVDGSSEGAVSSYSFTNVTSDHTISASFAVADLNTGLAGHWKLDEESDLIAHDSSEYLNHGTLLDGPKWTSGKINNALLFDGEDDYVEIGVEDIPYPWTAVFWVQKEASSKSNVSLLESASCAIKLEQYPDINKNVGVTAYGVADYSFNYEAPVGIWSHLVFVANQAQIALYVNGVPTDTVSASISCPIAQISSTSRTIKGKIDDVRIYNRALSADEIKELYSAGNENPNLPPTAYDDDAIVNEDSKDNIIDVLANDTDPENDILTITSVTQATNGSVAITGGGTSLTYTPTPDYYGSDSFTYTISDGQGGIDTAMVSITVTNIPDDPEAVDDSAVTDEDTDVTTGNVLTNDTDADGDTLTIDSFTQVIHGTVAYNDDGTFTYTPAANYNGNDSFDYTISDGNGGTDTATVSVTVIPVLPTVVSATATKFGVEVSFSEDLEQSSAENINNYALSSGILINAAMLNAENNKVTLYTSGHSEDTIYTLTITGVEDLAANPISEIPIDYTYDSGLIGLWNFNTDGGNTALDTSGYDNTATLVNGPVWTEQGDLNFDGIDDAVEIPTNYWNINSGTVALWAYAEDLAGTHYLFGHTTGSGSDRIQLYTLDQNLNLGLGNSDELNVENLDSQTWHHIALTWDATNYVVYVDGIEKASGFYTGLNDLSESADIGNSGDVSFDNAFAGHIDDARVYERALTPDEVVNVYLMSDESIRESKALAFEVSATYPDGTGLTYSINQLPDGATFEDDTFTWNPWYDQAGIYNITFLPDDQQQPQYSQTMTIVVEDVQLSDWYQTWLEHLGLL